MKKARVGLGVIILMAFLVSCSSFTRSAYVTLNESKDLYTIAMSTVADFQNKGIINQAKRDEINRVAKIYKEAHNLAVDALAVYKQTGAAADKDKLIVALSSAATKWQQVAALINAIKPNSVHPYFTK